MIWKYQWLLSCWLKKTFICFWKGHDERAGSPENYETDWCERCSMDEPCDAVTFPRLWEEFIWHLPEWLYIRLAK